MVQGSFRFLVWVTIFVTVAISSHCHQVNASDLAYRFQLRRGPVIEVSLDFTASENGDSILELAKEWGGIVNDGSDVNHLTVHDSDGNSIPVERTSPTSWQIQHENEVRLTARYEIKPPGEREPIRGGNDYRTRFDANLFQVIGNLALLMPQHYSEDKKIRFQVSFHGFDEIGWQIASSYGLGPGPFEFEWTRSQFLHAVVMAGNIDIAKRMVGDQQIAVAVAGRGWMFATDQLADSVKQIVQAERDFFDDHTDPWYLVTLTPLPAMHPGSSSFGGTAVTNCFALYCTPNLNLQPESADHARTLILLAHEYFHNWNGIKIPTAGNDPSTYWFSEGFTNYFSRKILLRAGLITPDQFLENLNTALHGYESNEYKSASNAIIAEAFWSNRNVGELPYQRGDLLALMLDEHIRSRSEGKQSIDNLMLDLFENPISQQPITTEHLLERINDFVDESVGEKIRKIVMVGADIPTPSDVSEPKLALATAQTRSFAPGFDIEKTREAKQLVGVIESSEAWNAGLRDGQILQGLSIQSGNGPPTAEVTILIDGEAKKVEYTPLSEPRQIRVYQLVPETKD
jgi:predicted metalloprotease with PDZ domain